MSWAIEEKGYSQRRACGLIGLEPKTYRYASTRGDDAAVRVRLRSLAGERRSCPSMRWKFGVELERPSVRRPEVELL